MKDLIETFQMEGKGEFSGKEPIKFKRMQIVFHCVFPIVTLLRKI